MAKFVNEDWGSPENQLSAEEFCACSLVDLNESGKKKVESKCYLPVKKTPDGPYYLKGMASAAAYLDRTQVPEEEKRRAARKLRDLYHEAGEPVPESVRKYI